jgi:histidinol-phosphate phosphatase family protein
MSPTAPSFDVVIPTTGRGSLAQLLEALAAARGPRPARLVVVDDRRHVDRALPIAGVPEVEVVRGPARGPAAARNAGWRAGRSQWVAFLDDDVVPAPDWLGALADDLAGLPEGVAGSEGRIEVPLPQGRRPTDWERNVAALEEARWATADMAFLRSALAAVGGFDERFPRAYREDADLGLRLLRTGHEMATGGRRVSHPIRPADRWISVRLQAGNADDVLMRRLHGPGWRERAGAPRGRLRRHLGATGAGLAGLGALAAGRRRAGGAALALWLTATGELAWTRVAPGPRTPREVATMLLTSIALPPAAAYHWARGHLVACRLLRHGTEARRGALEASGTACAATPPATAPAPAAHPTAPEAVLLDRDGTLVADVPYNGDPARVRPMPGARDALERLRGAGVRLAVVSNQSGVGRGLISEGQVHAVNRRVEELLGPLGPWLVCPHAPEDGCGCRKPEPGLVLRAAQRLGVRPDRCAVVGDIEADVEAARAAGARGVLVPTPRTRREEVETAAETARDLPAAVELLLGSAS